MRIQNTKGVGIDKLKFLIFGDSGSGKTTLAGTIKEPTLVISAEAGLLPLRNKNIDFIDISLDDSGKMIPEYDRITRLAEVYKYIQKPDIIEKYKWIYLDSLTEISNCLIARLQKEFPDRSDALVLYGENNKQLKSIIKLFRDIPHYNIAMTALASLEKDESGMRFKGVNVIGKLAHVIPSFFDEVLYLGIIEKDGESKRFLRCQPDERISCKDRSGALNKFERPDLQLLVNKIKDSQ